MAKYFKSDQATAIFDRSRRPLTGGTDIPAPALFIPINHATIDLDGRQRDGSCFVHTKDRVQPG